MAFVRAKGSVCAGERDRWTETAPLACGARRVLPDLYHFGGNSFLLVGEDGEGFVVDPTLPSIERVEALMAEVGVRTVTAATASHYHLDHSDGLGWLRDRCGAEVWLLTSPRNPAPNEEAKKRLSSHNRIDFDGLMQIHAQYNEAVRRVGAEVGALVVDMDRAYRRYEDEPAFLPTDVPHPAQGGHVLEAETLYSLLVRRGILRPAQ